MTRQETINPEIRAGVRRWLIKGYIGVAMTALTLFLPAGRWDWINGWAYVGLWFLWHTAMAITLIPTHPGLIAERAKRQKGDKPWDVWMMSLYGLITLAYGIVAGFDVRYGWSGGADGAGPFPLWAQRLGGLLVAAGFAVVVWAMHAYAYFSTIVRIQDDRGHTVATEGPYRIVRHPGYTGQLLNNIGTPLLLNSLWTLPLAVAAAVIFVVRTALEDRTLQDELPGYAAYTQQTRYRLIPGIW